ncbi:hypothetical protein CPB85DRAFT_412252 [Mucidula mucida]|nr:hypothetical protein CPB85DRAFT_412252 [Mucidula mucida]
MVSRRRKSLGTIDAEYSEDEEYTQSQATVPVEKPVPSSTTVKQLPRRSPRQHEGSLEPVVKSKPEGKSKSKQNSCNDKRDADEERPSTPPRLNVGVSLVSSAPHSKCLSSSEMKLKRKRSDECIEDEPAVKVRRADDGSSIAVLPAISQSAPACAVVHPTPDVTPLTTISVAPPSPDRSR